MIRRPIRLNRRRAARAAERRFPQFEERLLTFSERMEQNPGDPFLQLLADDTLAVAHDGRAQRRGPHRLDVQLLLGGGLRRGSLIWLGIAGPGFLGYGTSLLWGGLPKGEMKPYYDIEVEPGNRTIRKRADQLIHGAPDGFHGAQGALLRQVRQRVPVGAGRDGRGSRAARPTSS